jgi:hypothetical protein
MRFGEWQLARTRDGNPDGRLWSFTTVASSHGHVTGSFAKYVLGLYLAMR